MFGENASLNPFGFDVSNLDGGRCGLCYSLDAACAIFGHARLPLPLLLLYLPTQPLLLLPEQPALLLLFTSLLRPRPRRPPRKDLTHQNQQHTRLLEPTLPYQ